MKGLPVGRSAALATIAVAFTVSLGGAQPANAFVASAAIDDLTATLNLAGSFNRMTVSVADGFVVHDPADPVFDGTNSRFDWTAPGLAIRPFPPTARSPSLSTEALETTS